MFENRIARRARGVMTATIAVLVASCASSSPRGALKPAFDTARIQRAADEMTDARIVPGLSLAVFTSKGVQWSTVSGVKDLATGEKVTLDTAFEAASLSKTLFAYIAVQELSKAHAGLDTPLAPPPSVETSKDRERFAQLTPRQLLSHSTGLPNWRGTPDLTARTFADFSGAGQMLSFVDEPGKFHYSGEGFLYLQEQLERLTGQPLQALASKDVFTPLRMGHSSYLFTANVSKNFANSYSRNGERADKYQPAVGISAVSLHTTASDYARFLAELVRVGGGTTDLAELIRPVVTAEQGTGFEVQWALGLGRMRVGSRSYLLNWGDNDTFKAYFLYSLDDDIGFVYFANGAAGLAIRNRIGRAVLGHDVPMWPPAYAQAPETN
jgi:CubicO group peptidase (beta-lactamase class C family)